MSTAVRIARRLTPSQRAIVQDAANGGSDRISQLVPLGLATLRDYRVELTDLGRQVADLLPE